MLQVKVSLISVPQTSTVQFGDLARWQSAQIWLYAFAFKINTAINGEPELGQALTNMTQKPVPLVAEGG